MNRFRAWLIRRLGVTECGQFGGYHTPTLSRGDQEQRWCVKPYGHTDSCAYDTFHDSPMSQPGFWLRRRFKGWN